MATIISDIQPFGSYRKETATFMNNLLETNSFDEIIANLKQTKGVPSIATTTSNPLSDIDATAVEFVWYEATLNKYEIVGDPTNE